MVECLHGTHEGLGSSPRTARMGGREERGVKEEKDGSQEERGGGEQIDQ